MDYQEFLQAKFKFSKAFGFEVPADAINAMLKPHQSDIVRWAISKGRAAIFAAFGLGKSFMQIEIQHQIYLQEGGRHLIVLPLGVRQEFKADTEKLGYGRDRYQFVRHSDEVGADGFYMTNYESVRDGKLDVNLFLSVSLDEASILRSYGSKTYQEFLPLFGNIKYRFVATATPSPNRYKELIHYAGFLGVMDTGQALTRFFKRDSSQAGNLQLHPHKEKEFFLWLHSWAIFIQKPSDLGYSDEGYDLPPLEVVYHEVKTRNIGGKVDRDGQIQLINDAALGLKDAADEKRDSIDERIAQMLAIIEQDPEAHYLLWHDVNRMRTLNGDQTQRGLNNHICPLQFDIVDRVITRYTNKGDKVYDPFGGLFTVPYRAIKLGRYGRAAELNPGYFHDGTKYLVTAEKEIDMPTLFDFEAEGMEKAA